MELAPCTDCGGRRFWHVGRTGLSVAHHVLIHHESRDVAAELLIAKGLPDDSIQHWTESVTRLAPVELLICASCRATSWSCPSLDGELEPGVGGAQACETCGPIMLPVDIRLDENRSIKLHLVHGIVNYCEGSYSHVICLRCRGLDWFGVELQTLRVRAVPGLPSVERACRRCHHGSAWQQTRLRYHDRGRLRVLRPSGRWRGHFNASICRACGFASLRAELTRPPAGADILELAPPASENGPYR